MRCDQIVGLNPWADELVSQTEVVIEKGVTTWPDGRTEPFERQVKVCTTKFCPSGKKYTGMFDDKYDLRRYTLSDGRVFEEFVQAEPLVFGSSVFLCFEGRPR